MDLVLLDNYNLPKQMQSEIFWAKIEKIFIEVFIKQAPVASFVIKAMHCFWPESNKKKWCLSLDRSK